MSESVHAAGTRPAPVIAIDGPSASGKGTLAVLVAQGLGDWHVLDSGALYRLTALACERHGVDGADVARVAELARGLDVRFGDGIRLGGEEVSLTIRREAIGNLASQVAAYPEVREALLERQRALRRAPGLVADGRDMGTVVFPDAVLKVFLVASAEARAERRYRQLMEKGVSASMQDLLADLRARDARDMGRQTAPLKPAPDARILDSSYLSIEETVRQVLTWYGELGVSSPAGSRAS